MKDVPVFNMRYQRTLQGTSTRKSETLCIPASVTFVVPASGHSCELRWLTSPQRLSLSETEILRYSF